MVNFFALLVALGLGCSAVDAGLNHRYLPPFGAQRALPGLGYYNGFAANPAAYSQGAGVGAAFQLPLSAGAYGEVHTGFEGRNFVPNTLIGRGVPAVDPGYIPPRGYNDFSGIDSDLDTTSYGSNGGYVYERRRNKVFVH